MNRTAVLTHENLKEGERSDGAGSEFRGSGEGASGEEAAQKEEGASADWKVPGSSDPWPLVAGERGREGASAAASAGDHELLDGPVEQDGCVPGAFGEAGAFLAANGPGRERHGGGPALAASIAREESST